jgi:hypothetical protein
MSAGLMDEFQKNARLRANISFQETSGKEKEHMRRGLRAAVEKEERSETELYTIHHLTED